MVAGWHRMKNNGEWKILFRLLFIWVTMLSLLWVQHPLRGTDLNFENCDHACLHTSDLLDQPGLPGHDLIIRKWVLNLLKAAYGGVIVPRRIYGFMPTSMVGLMKKKKCHWHTIYLLRRGFSGWIFFHCYGVNYLKNGLWQWTCLMRGTCVGGSCCVSRQRQDADGTALLPRDCCLECGQVSGYDYRYCTEHARALV